MIPHKKPRPSGTLTATCMLGALAIALLAVAPGAGAQVGLYWWVGPCNGAFVNAQFGDTIEYFGNVQDDPVTATGGVATSTEENGLNYADCVVAGTDRVQVVIPGRETDTVIVEDCRVVCKIAWQSLDGSPSLTLRCLDDGETVVWVGSDRPSLTHRCIVESTLQRNGASLSVVAWKTILA